MNLLALTGKLTKVQKGSRLGTNYWHLAAIVTLPATFCICRRKIMYRNMASFSRCTFLYLRVKKNHKSLS